MTDNEVRRLLAILEADTTPAPTVEVWPCDSCREQGDNTPGIYNLGRHGYCINHLGALYAKFDPVNLPPDKAFGYTIGPSRPDWGLAYADLTCYRCQATWTGIPGEQCWWCRSGQEALQEHQAEMLLEAPSAGPNYEQRIEAWAERLARGVEAGIITERQARNAGRAVDRSRAA